MTENLAGRGEGLAGLVAQIKKWRDDAEIGKKKLSGAGMALSPTRNEMVGYIRACDDMLEVLAALEAAARLPAAPECPKCGSPMRDNTAFYLCQNPACLKAWSPVALSIPTQWQEIPLRAALATPSPQAPQCCCKASWLDLDQRDCPIHGPAATQEQPAGSGAEIGKVGASIDFRFAGAPRKVGEDGDSHLPGRIAARLDEYKFVEQMISGVEKEDWYKRRVANLEAMYQEALRPSSVPVGEQKQEEGV